MAPPLVKGRALARRRVAGVLFIAVLAMLVQASIWTYQKRFVDVVEVSLKTDRIGNQLTTHADVKLRGIIVGEVRGISSSGDVATLELALDPDEAERIPKDVRAQLLPKTLFGEKQVVLVPPDFPSGGHLEDGDVIEQDRSETALETEQALNDLLPLLRELRPEVLSSTLNNLSEAVRDRGERIGRNFVAAEAYFRRINPELPDVGADFDALGDVTDNLADASPDLLRQLDNFAASSRSLVEERKALDAFLASTRTFATTAERLVADNEKRFVALARDSRAPLELYSAYSNMFPCFLNRVAFAEIEGERVFGGAQPGLHITLEFTEDNGGYVKGDEPEYGEDMNSGCFGLGPNPIRPFPQYSNPKDGYRDGEPAEDPGQGPGGCCRRASSAEEWAPSLAVPPRERVLQRRTFPPGTTQLDALLLGPIAGAG